MSIETRSRRDQQLQAALADVLQTQAELNTRVGQAVQAGMLTADHLDSELTEMREDIAALGNRIESVVRILNARTEAQA